MIVTLLVAVSAAACATVALILPRVPEQGLLLPADHAVVLADRQIAATFGMQNPIVWVIAAREGDIWQTALLSRVHAMSRDVFAIPGVIGPEIVSLASPNVRDFRSSDEILGAVYLMGSVPETPVAIEALRRRVERDPFFHGTLVSLDGRAAMVVADFQPDADGAAVAAAATAVRDRYRDEQADVYVTGAPLVAAVADEYRWRSIAVLVGIVAIGAIVLVRVAGPSVALAISGASALSLIWALAVSFALDFALLPWVVYGILPAALLAPVFAVGPADERRRRAIVAAGLVAGFIGIACAEDVAAQTFGVAGVCGVLSAFVAGGLVRELFVGNTETVRPSTWIRVMMLCIVPVVAIGFLRSNVSLQLFGHGARYLPAAAGADLHGVARYFPPPLTFAARLHGEPGFVASPQVLQALDGWTTEARKDPAVARAMSLADLVKMVHRAFNDDRPDLAPLPDDAALVSRYLTLAYSPGFRRFLDRSFSQTAVWTYVSSERPSDVARVGETLSAAMASHLPGSAEVDVMAGDAAILLELWRTWRGVVVRGLVALLVAAVFVGAWAGPRTGARFVSGGLCAGAFLGGAFGWLGLPFDLVTLPAMVSAVVAGSAWAALGAKPPVGGAFAVVAVAGVAATLMGSGSLGIVTAGVLLSPLIANVCVPRSRV